MRPLALALASCAAALVGCGAPDPAAPAAGACAVPAGTASMVLTRFAFVRQDPTRAAVADGFDLDGRTSTAGDALACRQPDFTAPDGTAGIDNQLARLIPIVDQMTGGVLDMAVQTAINNGQLLVGVTVDELQDRCNDPSVTVRFQRVQAMPFVGADMRIDPGQTFDLMRAVPVTSARGRVRDGVLTIDPVDLPLPVAVLDAQFVLTFYGARLRFRLDDAGGGEGIIGGGLSADEFIATVRTLTISQGLMMTVASALHLFADLSPDADGRCQRVSGAMALSARSAFINP